MSSCRFAASETGWYRLQLHLWTCRGRAQRNLGHSVRWQWILGYQGSSRDLPHVGPHACTGNTAGKMVANRARQGAHLADRRPLHGWRTLFAWMQLQSLGSNCCQMFSLPGCCYLLCHRYWTQQQQLYDIWYMIYDVCYNIWFDMIWYDMIWYDMNDMIWYDMIWYDMIWYDMIWYDMIRYDTIRYDIYLFNQYWPETGLSNSVVSGLNGGLYILNN